MSQNQTKNIFEQLREAPVDAANEFERQLEQEILLIGPAMMGVAVEHYPQAPERVLGDKPVTVEPVGKRFIIVNWNDEKVEAEKALLNQGWQNAGHIPVGSKPSLEFDDLSDAEETAQYLMSKVA
jgi:hypothetical protein